jgi:hypothetical protein
MCPQGHKCTRIDFTPVSSQTLLAGFSLIRLRVEAHTKILVETREPHPA